MLENESLTAAPAAYGQRTVPLSDLQANGGLDTSFMDLPRCMRTRVMKMSLLRRKRRRNIWR